MSDLNHRTRLPLPVLCLNPFLLLGFIMQYFFTHRKLLEMSPPAIFVVVAIVGVGYAEMTAPHMKLGYVGKLFLFFGPAPCFF